MCESPRVIWHSSVKSPFPKTATEHSRNEPENQMQCAHPGQRLGGLRKNPSDGREPDEQNCHQHQQSGEESADFDEPRCEPLKQVKMYRLGRQISAEIIKPTAILAGAIQSCAPPENVPTTTP